MRSTAQASAAPLLDLRGLILSLGADRCSMASIGVCNKGRPGH